MFSVAADSAMSACSFIGYTVITPVPGNIETSTLKSLNRMKTESSKFQLSISSWMK